MSNSEQFFPSVVIHGQLHTYGAAAKMIHFDVAKGAGGEIIPIPLASRAIEKGPDRMRSVCSLFLSALHADA